MCPGAFLFGITWLLPAYFFPLATYKKHLPAKLIPFTSKFTIALFLNLFFYYPIHAYNFYNNNKVLLVIPANELEIILLLVERNTLFCAQLRADAGTFPLLLFFLTL